MKKYLLISILLAAVIGLSVPASAMEYQHEVAVKDMTFSWTIEGDLIHVMLTAKTEGWVGIGFDPEDDMEGANIIIGAVKGDKFKVEDHYGNRKRGHKSDTELGGQNNVLNPLGVEKDGTTTISFSYPLKTDDKYDKPIVTDAMMKIMMAYGAGRDSFKTRHPYRTEYEINLSTGEHKKIK